MEKAKTRVTVTVTSDDGKEPNAQAAPASGSVPGDAGLLDETAEGDTAVLGDDVTRSEEPVISDAVETEVETKEITVIELEKASVLQLVTALKNSMTEISELKKTNLDLTTKVAGLEENFLAAREIIEKIADLPIGKKTRFMQATGEFRARFPMYDEDFVRMLER